MTEQIINVERIEHMVNLFGSLDENIKLLEREYGVNIVCRDTELKICGEAEAEGAYHGGERAAGGGDFRREGAEELLSR